MGLKGVHVIRAELHSDQAAQKATAHTVAQQIQSQLDSMFDKAYVDPDSWGDTGEIEDWRSRTKFKARHALKLRLFDMYGALPAAGAQLAPVALTNVSPAGRASTNVTFVAAASPLLVTLIV